MNKQQLLAKWSEPHKVLDKGHVRLVDCMGDDASIVQMARVSYGEGTKNISDDRTLIRYLMRHRHTSPFEGCVIKLHMKLPILVARQIVRHRTSSLNEVSARYSVLPDEFYVPDLKRISYQSLNNKQGSGSSFEPELAKIAQQDLESYCASAYTLYENFIEQGMARELARSILPVNIYTEWYWVQNIHNLFHLIQLRAHPHAQYETRQYANAISDIVKDWLPITHEAFEDYRLNSVHLSAQQWQAIKLWLHKSQVDKYWFSEGEGEESSSLNNLPKETIKAWFDRADIESKRERLELWEMIK